MPNEIQIIIQLPQAVRKVCALTEAIEQVWPDTIARVLEDGGMLIEIPADR